MSISWSWTQPDRIARSKLRLMRICIQMWGPVFTCCRTVCSVDVRKKPADQETPLHNRWHPEIPPVRLFSLFGLYVDSHLAVNLAPQKANLMRYGPISWSYAPQVATVAEGEIFRVEVTSSIHIFNLLQQCMGCSLHQDFQKFSTASDRAHHTTKPKDIQCHNIRL